MPAPPPKLTYLTYIGSDQANLREHASLETTVLDEATFAVDEFEFISLMLQDSDGTMLFDELDGAPLTLPIWEDDIFLFDEEGTITVRSIGEDKLGLRDDSPPWLYVQVLEYDKLTYEEHELPMRNQVLDQDQLTVEEYVDMKLASSARTDSDIIKFIEDSIAIRYSLSDSDASRAAGA